MTDKSKAELDALFADNNTGNISEGDLRDFVDSVLLSVNSLRPSSSGNIDILAGSNVTVTPSSSGITIAATDAVGVLSLESLQGAVNLVAGSTNFTITASSSANSITFSVASATNTTVEGLTGAVDLVAGSSAFTVSASTATNGITLDVDQSKIDHDSLANFVSAEHVDHSSVSITAGAGLSGGGTIDSTRSLAVDINGQTLAVPADGDEILIVDASAANALRKATTLSLAELATPKLVGTTSGATSVDLLSAVTGAQISIASNKVYTFVAYVTGKQTGGSAGTTYDSWSYKVEGCISNVGGTTALKSQLKTVFHEDASGCDCVAEADDSNEYLTIKCTGVADRNIYWESKVILTGGT